MSEQLLLKNLNPQQQKAITHQEGPLLIIAGAGTGKTTVITQRVAFLIEKNMAKSDEILALTFTDKAANEMEERVDKLLPYGYLDLWISTFHSFCERILKNHGLEIGIPNNFKLLNQTEQWLLVRQNLDKFNLEYFRPLGNPAKFIHALLRHFSRAEDEEVGPEEYLQYAKDFKLSLDQAEATGGSSKQKLKIKNIRDNSRKNSRLIREKGRSDKELQGKLEVDETRVDRTQEIANAYHVYQQLLLDNNSLDFGDLINYTLRLFRKRPNILEEYRKKFKYILVDEFQDTNWAQYELVKLIASPKNNLTVVGDDDQAIYRWRGASYNNVIQFKKDFPKCKEIFLVKNFRSKQSILDLAYKFIQLNNPERLEVKLETGKLSKKLLTERKGEGIIEHLHLRTESEEAKAVVDKIIELKTKDEDRRQGLKTKSSSLKSSVLSTDEVSWNDFAILVRANAHAGPFISELERRGIPYQYLASRGLYTKPVVLDILAYLKLLDNYHESPSLWRILNLPIFKIDPQDLVEINFFAKRKSWSLYEALTKARKEIRLKEKIYKTIDKILNLITAHTRLSQEKSVSEVLLSFLEDTGYLKYLTQSDTQAKRDALSFLNQFYRKIEEFEKSFTDKSVKNFISGVDLELEAGEEGTLSQEIEEGPEAVKIMTVHGAKGLEFRYVFIANLVDKRFPTMDRKEPIELPLKLIKEIIPSGDIHLQEERRLFYVALTRAKDGVFFTSALDYGGARKKRLSRFLYEIGFESRDEKGRTRSTKDEEGIMIKRAEAFPIHPSSSLVTLHLPSKFSFTQLKAFETCPYQYRFTHILKVPVKSKFTFSFGHSMHNTLCRFFQLMLERSRREQGDLFGEAHKTTSIRTQINIKNLPSLEELLKIYKESWIEDWYESKSHLEEYKRKGIKILKDFYKKIKDGVPRVKYLERGFNFKLEGYTIKGVIDRVDQIQEAENNQPLTIKGIEIIDYKTGSVKELNTADKDQLLIYQIAAEEVLNEKPLKLTYWYLNENKPVSFLGSKEDLDYIKEKIIKTVEAIKTSDFKPTPSLYKCKFCDFKEICEYRIL